MGKKVRIGLEGLELATMDMTTESDPYFTISTTLEEMCRSQTVINVRFL